MEERRVSGMSRAQAMWSLLGRLPAGWIWRIKRHLPPGLRYWLRQNLGADFRSLPERIVQVADGRRFRTHPDTSFWALSFGLEPEPEGTRLVRALVRPGDVVVDVGANIGWYTTLAAVLVGEEGRVLAFEPVPRTREWLLENLEMNPGANRIRVFDLALGDRAGTLPMFVPRAQGSGLASLAAGGPDWVEEPVTVARLDEVLRGEGIDRVDLVKCDVEGAELRFLEGCGDLLRRSDAPILFLELNAEALGRQGCTRESIWRLLVDVGYDRFYALPEGSVVREGAGREEVCTLGMVLCAKGNRVEKRLENGALTVRRATHGPGHDRTRAGT